MNFDVNEIKITVDPMNRYIIPSDWFKQVILYCEEYINILKWRKVESIIKLGICNEQLFDIKKKRIKPEVNHSQMSLVIYEIMVKLCDYFEYDLIAKVQFSKKINFENIEFYSKMPIIKVKKFVDNQDSANENFNLSSNNKIINFCSEQDDIKEKVFKPSQDENSFNKNKLSETKNKDKYN